MSLPLVSGMALFFIATFIFSVFISSKVFGHVISIGRIRLFSVSDLRYSHKSGISSSISHLKVTFHIPRRSNPRWATVVCTDIKHVDPLHQFSVKAANIALWFFPVFFRFTGGPWITAEMIEFKLQVFSSMRTPGWVGLMRNNLITTVLTGQYLRLDDIATKINFGPLMENGSLEEGEKPGTFPSEELDDIRLSAFISRWHLRNWQNRIYTTSKVDGQLRRSWAEDRGTFVMVAEDCKWTLVPDPLQKQNLRISTWVWQLLHSIANFPPDMFKIIRDPLTTIDLFISRLDVTFDEFRIRDTELLERGSARVKQKWDEKKAADSFHDFCWDAFTQAILTVVT